MQSRCHVTDVTLTVMAGQDNTGLYAALLCDKRPRRQLSAWDAAENTDSAIRSHIPGFTTAPETNV